MRKMLFPRRIDAAACARACPQSAGMSANQHQVAAYWLGGLPLNRHRPVCAVKRTARNIAKK